jgi:hypothetical protein
VDPEPWRVQFGEWLDCETCNANGWVACPLDNPDLLIAKRPFVIRDTSVREADEMVDKSIYHRLEARTRQQKTKDPSHKLERRKQFLKSKRSSKSR